MKAHVVELLEQQQCRAGLMREARGGPPVAVARYFGGQQRHHATTSMEVEHEFVERGIGVVIEIHGDPVEDLPEVFLGQVEKMQVRL